MAQTETWDSSSDEGTTTVPKPRRASTKKSQTDENIANEATGVRRSNRPRKPTKKSGGPETTSTSNRASKHRSQTTTTKTRKSVKHQAPSKPTPKQATIPPATKAPLISQDYEDEDSTRPSGGVKPTQSPTSRVTHTAHPTGGYESATSGEELSAQPTGGYKSAHLPKSGSDDTSRPSGGYKSTLLPTPGAALPAYPTGGYESATSGEELTAQPSGGYKSTTPGEKHTAHPTGEFTSAQTRGRDNPTWLDHRERPHSDPPLPAASMLQQPPRKRAPATHRTAISSQQNLTSAGPARGPARAPAPNRHPRIAAKDTQPYTITQYPVESDNEAPPAVPNKKHSTHNATSDEESDDNASHQHSTCSYTSDSNDSDLRTHHQTSQPPGTLLHRFPITGTSRSSSGEEEAAHILQWLRILKEGPTKFERATARNRRHPSEPIAIFAMVGRQSTVITAAHGFGTIIVLDENHTANGRVGFFLGDRIAAPTQNGWHLQNPPLGTTRDWTSLLSTYTGSPATERTISKSQELFLPPTTDRTRHCIPSLFPIPHAWWPTFLGSPLTVLDGFNYINTVTQGWTSDNAKKAARAARLWARCACTQHEANQRTSGVTIPTKVRNMDPETLSWAHDQLGSYLPTPDQTRTGPPTLNHAATTTPSRTEEIALQLSAAAHSLIQSAIERTDTTRATTKEIPENLTCFLLGISGLAWDDRHLLAPIWTELYKQPNKSTREVTLQTFFAELSAQVPSFREFSNTTLSDNIINHKLAPGPTYETCHHGISILAVSLRTFTIQELERQEETCFDLATNKTPDAIKKHMSKGPPPLPTTISELIQQIHRLLVLTDGLFTHRCAMVTQLRELMEILQVREHRLMGDYASSAQLIPQVVWALILSARDFYRQVCTRSQLDPTVGTPRTATASLSTYTHMIALKMKLDLDGLPHQWTAQPARHPTTEQHTSTASKQPSQKNSKPATSNNQPNPSSNTTTPTRNNAQWPNIFASNDTLKLLQAKKGRVLSEIFSEAGISGGGDRLDLTGLPDNLCLRWLILGRCNGGVRGQECNRSHPTTSIPTKAAEAVFRQIEPGLKRIAEKLKRQRTE